MRFGLHLPNAGLGGDPRVLADVARDAEAAGWDGLFVWDTVYLGPPHTDFGAVQDGFDVWLAFAAIALATERLRFGPLVAALPRQRPWVVARQCATLDHLSGGRLVLPVGFGDAPDGGFAKVGEPTDRRTRRERLDEAIDILTGLWEGEPFHYDGTHYRVEEMTFLPRPVQRPRIPIWPITAWPRGASVRRALRCDGGIVFKMREDGTKAEMSPDDVRAFREHVADRRRPDRPFDIVMESAFPSDGREKSAEEIHAYADAGVTWWLDATYKHVERTPDPLAGVRSQVRRGPPRIG